MTPAPKPVTGSVSGVSSGTLFIKVVVNGAVVSNVFINVSGSTGVASVVPARASTLGVGTFSGTITVTACLNDPTCATGQLAGSPQTINVSYQVASPVQGDAVAPRIAIANTVGNVIVRGNGFSQAAVQDVTFGGLSATGFSRVGDTEIHASYPALLAGSHSVQLIGSSGPLPFAATLVVIDPPNYHPATLNYPAPPQEVRALLYDAERQALLVAVSFANRTGNQILRYQFANGSYSRSSNSLRTSWLGTTGLRLLLQG